MKPLTKEEYIAKKNKLEKKHNDWLIKNVKKREKLRNEIINCGTEYLTRLINHVDTFEEPRELIAPVIDMLVYFIPSSFMDAKISECAFQPNEFAPILEKLTKDFPYLDIKMNYTFGSLNTFLISVSLKKE